jgi:hypothetical protein
MDSITAEQPRQQFLEYLREVPCSILTQQYSKSAPTILRSDVLLLLLLPVGDTGLGKSH